MFIRWFTAEACSDAPAAEVVVAAVAVLLLLSFASVGVGVGATCAGVVVVVTDCGCVELVVFVGAAARAPGDDTDDDGDDDVAVGLDCAGFTRVLLLLMHLPNALLLLILLLFVLELFKFFADDVAAANRDECGKVPTFVDPIGPLAVDEIRVSYNSFISLMLLAGFGPSSPPPSAEALRRRFFSAGHSNPFGLWMGVVSCADRLCCWCCCSLPSAYAALFRSSSLFDFTLGLPAVDPTNALVTVWL